MKRKLIFAAIALVMVIVGIAVYLYNSMDSIVEAAIEKHGTRVMGTRVSVGSVDISLKSGRGTIRDLSVANPDGFSSGKMFTLDEIAVDIKVGSINRDPITIDEVTISAPSVLVEANAQGQTNVAVVKGTVEKYQSGTATSEHKEDGGFEKRFIIDRFVFEEGAIDLDATALGVEEVDLELPPLRLNNVGGPNGGTPDVIAKTVSRAFLSAVRNVVQDEVKQRATDKAKETLKEEAGKLIDKVFDRKAADDSSR